MPLSPGTSIGPYLVTGQLGTGGMGVVYRARDPRLGRDVAIKFPSPNLTGDASGRRRFVQEAKAASALDHPKICTIYDISETDGGELYLVMAFYAGETLRERLQRGALPFAEAVRIAAEIGEGLGRAHEAGIVHRDIKPANIMLPPDGPVKILDFGIAKLTSAETATETGATLGTVAYMAPEQVRGEVSDARTDVWALGVVLYEMLTGQRPFAGETSEATAMAILTSAPTSLRDLCDSLSAGMEDVVAGCLRKERDQRPASTSEVVVRLHGSGRELAETARTAPVVRVPSIAVLPFANMSADPDQEYFCEGLAEELIDALSRVEGLRVVARTSAFQFRGKGHDLREVGDKLKVKTVLEGSVRKSGNRLRVNTQLINTADGYHLWSERYDRDLDDVFAVQDEIAQAVVGQLKVTLLHDADKTIVRRPTPSIEAYQAFMRGRHYRSSRYDLPRATSLYKEALEHDPSYAMAWAGLADTAVTKGIFQSSAPESACAEARTAAGRALALDEGSSEAHAAQARISLWFDWDWAEAEREFKRAVELNPGNAEAYVDYGSYLGVVCRYDEAFAKMATACEVDPLSIRARIHSSVTLLIQRRFAEGLAAGLDALTLQPDNVHAKLWLSSNYWLNGQPEEGVACLGGVSKSTARLPIYLGFLGQALGKAGRVDDAHRILAELKARSRSEYVSPHVVAMVYAGLDEVDQAVDWLRKSLAERSPGFVYTQSPGWDYVRADPRGAELFGRLGLPDPRPLT